MDRKEFLSILGISAAAVVCNACLGGCQPNNGVTDAPTNVDFSLDLNEPANASLHTNGGYIIMNGVIVARTVAGVFVAVSSYCTHAGAAVQYVSSTNRFYCPSHGSNFATDGSVINGPANSPLMKYHTSLTGSTLRVFS